MIPISELIWVSAQPLVRLFLCVASGFIITKAGMFPAMAARSAGQLALNITVPSLMFSKIVPAFSTANIPALGPLIFVALLYEAIGIVISWIIKQIFWVPHRFRYGMLAAGGWGNVGDIPTAVLLSLTATAPFNGTSDQNLAVAYLAPFLLVFLITLFPLGGFKCVAMDFQGPDVSDEEVQERLRTKHKYIGAMIERAIISLGELFYRRRSQPAENMDHDNEKANPPISTPGSHYDSVSVRSTIVQCATEVVETKSESAPEPAIPFHRRLARFGLDFLHTLLRPSSSSIIVGFIISIVPVLKALFVPGVPGVNVKSAPDGQPPLAILLNTTTFIGGASVPLGLMILGSALARLEVPNGQLRSLPLGAVGALAIGRMVVMPVFGVLIIQGLTRVGFLDPNDHLLRLVCILQSCLPTGTTQVLLTQVYSGTGNAPHLSVFLIPQYILMFFTMTALIAYVLHLLDG